MEPGKTYDVLHCIKGKFRFRIERDDGDWVTGLIVAGYARGVRGGIYRDKGEKLTVRKAFLTSATEVTEAHA